LEPTPSSVKRGGLKFTVLSVATQRSWKNAEGEWVSKVKWHRISILHPRLAQYLLTAIKKGAHVLVEGSLVSSTYNQPNGRGKKATAKKIVSWTIRADVVRKLDRSEIEPETTSAQSGETPASDAPPF